MRDLLIGALLVSQVATWWAMSGTRNSADGSMAVFQSDITSIRYALTRQGIEIPRVYPCWEFPSICEEHDVTDIYVTW